MCLQKRNGDELESSQKTLRIWEISQRRAREEALFLGQFFFFGLGLATGADLCYNFMLKIKTKLSCL